MQVVKPPTSLQNLKPKGFSVFLAGSIEMGKAENWQVKIEELFANEDCFVFNPRRDNWDPTWPQDPNFPQFREQVEWELTALDVADWILMYFDPNTTSPITLLELGLYAGSGKLIVCCPDGYYRKGNVKIVCEQYGVPFFDTWEEFTAHITEK